MGAHVVLSSIPWFPEPILLPFYHHFYLLSSDGFPLFRLPVQRLVKIRNMMRLCPSFLTVITQIRLSIQVHFILEIFGRVTVRIIRITRWRHCLLLLLPLAVVAYPAIRGDICPSDSLSSRCVFFSAYSPQYLNRLTPIPSRSFNLRFSFWHWMSSRSRTRIFSIISSVERYRP